MEDDRGRSDDEQHIQLLSRAELERRVSERTAYLEELMDTMPDMLVEVDADGRITTVNSIVTELLGYEESTVVGKPIDFLFAEGGELDSDGGGAAFTDRLLVEKRLTDVEVAFETKRGETVPMSLSASALETDGTLSGFVCVAKDISERTEAEEEAELFRDVLTRFLRHNLRNDMTAVQMYLTRIEEQTDEFDSDLAAIRRIIDNVIETSSKARLIEQVIKQRDNREVVDVASLLETVAENARDEFPDVDFEVSLPSSLSVVANPYVGAAFENVVENAGLHTGRPCTVEITARAEDSEAVVEIVDDGPGIPQNEIDVLTEGKETPLEHSSGAGLWLVNTIVDKSGGSLDIENTVNGTRVEIRLQRVPDDA